MFEKLYLAKLRRSKEGELTCSSPLTRWENDLRRLGLLCPIRAFQSQYNASLIAFSEVARMSVPKSKDRSGDSTTLLEFLASSLSIISASPGCEVDCLADPKVKTVSFKKSELELVSSASAPSKAVWDVCKGYIFLLNISLVTKVVSCSISTPPVQKNTPSPFRLSAEIDKKFMSRSGTYKTSFILIVESSMLKATFRFFVHIASYRWQS